MVNLNFKNNYLICKKVEKNLPKHLYQINSNKKQMTFSI